MATPLSAPGAPPVPRGTGDSDPTNRVIRVDRAIACCQLAVDQALQVVNDFAVSFADVAGGEGLALVPGVVLPGTTEIGAPTIVRVFPGDVLPIGAVVIFSSAVVGGLLSKIAGPEIAEVLIGITNGVRTAVRAKGNDCERCMMRRALPQFPNRRRTKRSVRSRV